MPQQTQKRELICAPCVILEQEPWEDLPLKRLKPKKILNSQKAGKLP